MSIQDDVMPGGVPIGSPGNQRHVRVLPGGRKAAEAFFDRLSKGGTPNTPAGFPGRGVDVPGGWIGFRPVSGSGEPTIDIRIPGIPIRKLKFV